MVAPGAFLRLGARGAFRSSASGRHPLLGPLEPAFRDSGLPFRGSTPQAPFCGLAPGRLSTVWRPGCLFAMGPSRASLGVGPPRVQGTRGGHPSASWAPPERQLPIRDPGVQIGSAHGSYQNDGGPLTWVAADGGEDAEFGFQRPEFGQEALAGTVGLYKRHLFLCYKGPQVWPSHVEASEFDRLPRLLSAALKARKADIKKQTRLTLCEGEDGTESSNGDVLIFPDMIRYRRLTHFDVDTFVEEVLVKDTEWFHGRVETLTGSYIFVCSHGSRDKRCGVCGPPLIRRFKEEIGECGLQGQVTVSACSHIGGHKYAGNVIIFSPSVDGAVTGHWYGYVSPDDVPVLLEQHIGKGEVVTHLWRGQMGLSEEQQKKAQELRVQLNGDAQREGFVKDSSQLDGIPSGAGGCCQGTGNSTCCQNMSPVGKANGNPAGNGIQEIENNSKESNTSGSKGSCTRKVCTMPTWFERWEREDTYAALAVAAAVVSVVVAYSCYRQMR